MRGPIKIQFNFQRVFRLIFAYCYCCCRVIGVIVAVAAIWLMPQIE